MATSNSLITEEFRESIKPLDQYYGIYTTFSLAIFVVAWFRGAATTQALVLIGSFVALNLVISQISLRTKKALPIELVRYLVVATVLCPLCYLFATTGPQQHWWQGYLIFSLSSAITFQALTGRQTLGYFLIPYFLASYLAVTALWMDHPDWYSTIIDASTIAMNGLLMLKMVDMINAHLKREKERSNELSQALAQLRALQAQLVQSEKFAALGEMAGGMAHEVNTPLAVITTLSGQLKELLNDEQIDRGMALKFSEKIETTAFRIGGIISGLRSFSRDSSQDPMVPTPVKTIVADTISLCQEKLRVNGIKLTTDDIPHDLMATCRAGQISQVLLNLLNNANDALEKNTDKWVRVSARNTSSHVEILVTDSGSGIPAEMREKIFQPFFTSKDVGKGTGLGLSISLGIIRGHGGDLRLGTESANTQFVISLPKVVAPVQTPVMA